MRNIIFYLGTYYCCDWISNESNMLYFFNRQNVNQLCCNSWYYLSDLLFLHLSLKTNANIAKVMRSIK